MQSHCTNIFISKPHVMAKLHVFLPRSHFPLHRIKKSFSPSKASSRAGAVGKMVASAKRPGQAQWVSGPATSAAPAAPVAPHRAPAKPAPGLLPPQGEPDSAGTAPA